jgi:hypothetical protein
LGAHPSLGGWVAFGLEPSSLLESGSGAFLVIGPGGLRWSRDAPRICRPMRLDDSTLSAARYWFILPLGMYIFTTSMPSFYYYVMSTPASATTPFTVPWGRGNGRRAGVLLTGQINAHARAAVPVILSGFLLEMKMSELI